MKRVSFLLIALIMSTGQFVLAQDGTQPASYANLALQFSAQNFNGDPATGFLPTVSSANGFGSYADNPASVALLEENAVSFGLYNTNMNFENQYLGSTISSEDNDLGFGNVGVVYKLPTTQGSFVLGAGYNRLANSQNVSRLSARNEQSTITDVFREPDSDYYDIAFEAYATDWGDVDSTYLESIFRIGFDTYPGITQEAEITQVTNLGEYSFFFGTEFQKNLFFGVSAGITTGSYTYRRNFLEVDEFNDYNANFIPSDTEGEFTDIDNILLTDEIDSEIVGFALRTGLIYEASDHIRVGVSYKIPSTIIVREEYYSSITTELDDGSTPFQSDFASDGPYEYRIKQPGTVTAGFSLSNIANFDVSVSGEFTDHSNLGIDFVTGNDLDFNDEVALREQQNEAEDFMSANYRSTINVKTGLGYQVHEQVKVKAGYAYMPGRSSLYEADKNIISGGISAKITPNIILDLMGQYSFWNDRSIAYSYYDYGDGGVSKSETFTQDIQSVKVLGGVRILF